MKPILVALLLSLPLAGLRPTPAAGADAVFSGPQPGEKITPFKVLELTGPRSGKERDPVTERAGGPVALVFLHGVERSLVPLLRVIDQYGAERSNHLHVEVVFLNGDRLEGEQRSRAASRSLRLQSRTGLSLDGAEGPGNYGLNKECLMTVVAARSNVVAANFALVQPGIADAPRVLAALAALSGDTNPPPVTELSERQMARSGNGGRDSTMRSARARPAADGTNAGPGAGPAREPFPGAVPTDDKLQGLLRRFIRPTNDDATVDAVLAEVRTHIRDRADLQRQAIDGWTRILHFGDRYGTPHARKVGREFLEQLQREAK